MMTFKREKIEARNWKYYYQRYFLVLFLNFSDFYPGLSNYTFQNTSFINPVFGKINNIFGIWTRIN